MFSDGSPEQAPVSPHPVQTLVGGVPHNLLPPRSLGPVSEEGEWTRYWVAALRYRWLILAVGVVGTALAVAATRFIRPEYEAQATIWVEAATQTGGGGSPQPINQGRLLDSYAWVQLLKSFTILDEVVLRERLYLVPGNHGDSAAFTAFSLAATYRPGKYVLEVPREGGRFTLRTSEGTVVQLGAPGDSVGADVGFLWQPPEEELRPTRSLAFTVRVPRDASLELFDNLDAQIDPNGNFIKVSLNGPDADRTARTLNAVLDRYLEVASQLKKEKLTQLSGILDEQLGTSAARLKAAELALESFRVQTITLPSDQGNPVQAGLEQTRDPVFKSFFDTKVEREQLRQDRAAIERALAGDSGASVDALEVIPSVRESSELTLALKTLTEKQAELRTLQIRYTDLNPQVQKLLAETSELQRQTIPTLARSLNSQIAAREANLDSRIGSASQELSRIPPRAIEEARLRRAVEIAENLYTELQTRAATARLAEASSIPDVRALDRAVSPEKPITNTAPRIIAIGFLASLGFGLGLALLLDRLDRRLRYPEQVTSDLGLPILGAVPHLTRSRSGLGGEDGQPVIEALRGTRLNILHAYGATGPLVVTVTSPGPGDGKSFLSSNLALAFSDAGYRTLLIDGDTRRGALHRILGVGRVPGLTDALEELSSTAARGVIQTTEHAGLEFIGSGTRTRTGPELVGSNSMARLLADLRTRYSVIIVDSPPLGAGVDAFALGTLTGSLLLVLRTGTTDRQLASAKLDVLDRLPVRILGAVLNDVREARIYRYYAYNMEGYEAEGENGRLGVGTLPGPAAG